MDTVKSRSLERTLQIAVPLSQVEEEVGRRLKKLAKTARMQGFRPGKVPLKLLEQQYGEQYRQEVLGDLAQARFDDAVKEGGFRVAGLIRFEPKPSSAQDSVEFEAVFEVYPEVKVGDIKGISIEKPVAEVTEEDVNRTLQTLRRQRIRFEPVQREAREGDQLLMDFRGTLDGAPFPGGEGHDVPLVLGQGQFLPDFEKHLYGFKAGNSTAFDLTFPQDYSARNLAGKTVHFEVQVKDIQEGILPELNEDFVRQMGVADGNLDTLKAEVHRNLEREMKSRVRARLKDKAMQVLLDVTPLDLPITLVKQEVGRLRHNAQEELSSRGQNVGASSFPDHLFEEQARRRVSLGLILSELVEREQIKVKPEQVRAVIEEMAGAYENPQEVVRWYYQQPQQIREVEAFVLEENVVEWICAHGDARDVAMTVQQLTSSSQ